jgi:hypothetical protein
MKPFRVAIYVFIALVAMVFFYYVLSKEPLPDWPINLIHLLAKH